MNRTVRFPRMRQHGESRMPAAMLASYIPAARATAVEPMHVLRAE
jgi:hypothetical protein